MRVPATTGRERAPGVVLQAHLDMVCERDPDSPFDPREGRIDVSSRTTGFARTGRRSEPTTASASLPRSPSPKTARSRTARSSSCSRCPRSKGSTVRTPSTARSSPGACSSISTGRATKSSRSAVPGATTPSSACRCPPSPWMPTASSCSSSSPAPWAGTRATTSPPGARTRSKRSARVLSAAYQAVPFGVAASTAASAETRSRARPDALVAVPEGGYESFRARRETELAAILRLHRGTDDGLSSRSRRPPPKGAADRSATLRALDLLAAFPTGVLALRPDAPARSRRARA